ncbi:MAG: polysaccharide biosynthesis protein [Methylobacteriaceae bacterium]|nr:polysaccharide biosynthesis protein [Methylobacteriaceae bacterium]
MTALAFALSVFLRWPLREIEPRLSAFAAALPILLVLAAIAYRHFGLYRSKWRFASLPDLFNIFKAASFLAVALLVVDYAFVARGLNPRFLFGEKAAFLYWVLQMFLLGGPRLAYRYLKYVQSRRPADRGAVANALVLGRPAEAEIVLRALESGLRKRFAARGVLSPRASDLGLAIRGVQVLGDYGELERVVAESNDNNLPITRLIFAPSEFTPDEESERLLATARKLGIALLRMQTLEESEDQAALAPVEIEDLLFRPSVEVDRPRLAAALQGRRVLVTGGGGSIGSEICHRVVAFGAAQLMIVENSEPALHAILEALEEHRSQTRIEGALADVRDRDRLAALCDSFAPDLVFHAAALKQLPFLERDWAEGVKTNIVGSRNVADAARGAAAVVMISTDKAVDPVSVLGATKRFAEMYVQLADAEARAAGRRRLISVRFGNVLGSVGSVVPKFKAQIARGGPVTVTHPDMVRYFMTVREACDLVLTAAANAVAPTHAEGAAASVYVLKMGQPARIVDLARRMIRLAGFEPDKDIEIVFTGARTGERLNEHLFAADEPAVDIGVPGVTAARTPPVDRARMERWLADLERCARAGDRAGAEAILGEAIPAFGRRAVSLAEAQPSAVVTDLAQARRR